MTELPVNPEFDFFLRKISISTSWANGLSSKTGGEKNEIHLLVLDRMNGTAQEKGNLRTLRAR